MIEASTLLVINLAVRRFDPSLRAKTSVDQGHPRLAMRFAMRRFGSASRLRAAALMTTLIRLLPSEASMIGYSLSPWVRQRFSNELAGWLG